MLAGTVGGWEKPDAKAPSVVHGFDQWGVISAISRAGRATERARPAQAFHQTQKPRDRREHGSQLAKMASGGCPHRLVVWLATHDAMLSIYYRFRRQPAWPSQPSPAPLPPLLIFGCAQLVVLMQCRQGRQATGRSAWLARRVESYSMGNGRGRRPL